MPAEGKSGSAQPRAPDTAVAPYSERYAVGFAFLLYIVYQINASLHHGSWGQDFYLHRLWISDALNDPWRFLTKFEPGRTNPPLFHLFCALITFLAGTTRYLEAIGIVFSFINAAALYLLYRFLRETIADPFLRIA